jgi:hypothetical protein
MKDKFKEIRRSKDQKDETDWIMGELRKIARGNMSMKALHSQINGK